MARPQGTCTVTAANRILYGLAIVERITTASGHEEYQAAVIDGTTLTWKNNTELVAMVIDYAIDQNIKRNREDSANGN